MLRLKEYCDRVRDDAYGGSVELVEDGITAMANEIRATEPKDIMTEIEGPKIFASLKIGERTACTSQDSPTFTPASLPASSSYIGSGLTVNAFSSSSTPNR